MATSRAPRESKRGGGWVTRSRARVWARAAGGRRALVARAASARGMLAAGRAQGARRTAHEAQGAADARAPRPDTQTLTLLAGSRTLTLCDGRETPWKADAAEDCEERDGGRDGFVNERAVARAARDARGARATSTPRRRSNPARRSGNIAPREPTRCAFIQDKPAERWPVTHLLGANAPLRRGDRHHDARSAKSGHYI